MLGDILAPDNRRHVSPVDALKRLYAVQLDQDLAAILGSSKAAVAKWRRRGELPAWVAAKASADFPTSAHTFAAEGVSLAEVFAVALAIFDQTPPPVLFPEKPADNPMNMGLRGRVFADAVEVISRHANKVLSAIPDMDHVALIERCFADFRAGRIEGLTEALRRDF
jgi:hypothetical protein